MRSVEIASLHSAHPDVAEDRKQPDGVERPASGDRPQLGAGADRELDHPHLEKLGQQEVPALVRPETLRKLHTPVIDMPPRPDAKPGTPSHGRYGLGWGNVTMPFSPEPFVFHGGSNELNLAYIMLQPKIDLAMVMTTNIGGGAADKALLALAEELYQRFGAKR